MPTRIPTFAILALVSWTSIVWSGDALADPQPQPGARLLLRLARPATDFSSPYASPVKDAGPNLGHTAIARRLTGDGVTGSVGYLCGIDLFEPDGWQRGGGVDSSTGHKGTFLGAKLGYSFR